MAGPCFTLYFENSSKASTDNVQTELMKLTTNKEKKILIEKIGFVPKYSWTGCAMCKSPLDTDGLYFLLDLLVNTFGGYQRIENQDNIQESLIESNYVHKIECPDYFSYFGSREISEEEQKNFEQYVPLKSYLMVDLSKTRFRTLDY